MNEWIADRLPTSDDADCAGFVWVSSRDGKSSWYGSYRDVTGEHVWCSSNRPQSHFKPEPDISLAASIDREDDREICHEPPHDICTCSICDRKRILEAARKWDERRLQDDQD